MSKDYTTMLFHNEVWAKLDELSEKADLRKEAVEGAQLAELYEAGYRQGVSDSIQAIYECEDKKIQKEHIPDE